MKENFDDIFLNMPEKDISEEYEKYLTEWNKNYGTDKSFLLKDICNAGFKPIGITIMICEETFIFETMEECENAAKMFLPEGWWYDIESFKKARTEYVKTFYEDDVTKAPKVYWL
jgi:hypothetical protein